MHNSEQKNLNNIQERINYFFKDIKILKTCLTHSSFSNKIQSYERLEFLGDSIIGMVISESLFLKHSNLDQGNLSKQKSLIVNRKNLSLASQRINIIKSYVSSREKEYILFHILGVLGFWGLMTVLRKSSAYFTQNRARQLGYSMK